MMGPTTSGGAQVVALAGIDPFTLIVLLFIGLSALRGLFGQNQREQQRRRMEQQRREQTGQASSSGGQNRERSGESAADLVPDDLWELLTGERRQGSRQVPTGDWGDAQPDASTSVATEPEPGAGSEWEAIPEPDPYEPLTEAEEDSGHPWRLSDQPTPLVLRSESSDNLPEAVSLEQPVQYDDAQEQAFHQELASLPPPAQAHHRHPLPYGLGREDEVRRAFILTEILGPPKGLR